ncbi:hypothetical protein CVT26_008650 [Gymnopilus dilepis]|uniref:F-box domain-containing protein n=1 Tax=Gymnopilus dilepis TaxID=231916 RepID=A0A409XXX5_9AGAR|nr:hypothetical protein CVT26_008650 [Gymnopilus dilepis]
MAELNSQLQPIGIQPCLEQSRSFLFNSLPVEIASIIFSYHAHSDASWRPHPSLTLGKICRTWRQIAWATSSLWTRLIIRPRHATSLTHVELAEEWLSRSGTLPLSIEYSSYSDESDFDDDLEEVCERMFEVLSRCSNRWHTVTLELPSYSLEEFEILPHPPSMLHHLSLKGIWEEHEDFRQPDYPRIPAFSETSPKVVEISCVNVSLNWTSVTDLSLDLVDVAEVLFIFRTASSLSKCVLEEVSDHLSDISALMKHAPIICPALKSLSVSFGDSESSEYFCNAISLPALQHLSYGSHDVGAIELFVDDLLFFLTQSSCALESLVINESEFIQGSLIRLAPLLHYLKELCIEDGGDDKGNNSTNTFYHLLADPSQLATHFLPLSFSTTRVFLPSLEKFKWEGRAPYPWDTIPGLLEPVVSNGLAHRRPLTSVKINCKSNPKHIQYIPTDITRRLTEFNDVKFELTLNSSSYEGGTDLFMASLERSKEDCEI